MDTKKPNRVDTTENKETNSVDTRDTKQQQQQSDNQKKKNKSQTPMTVEDKKSLVKRVTKENLVSMMSIPEPQHTENEPSQACSIL